jgi:cytochrome b561
MSRYHPALVILHWLMALMMIMALMGGMFALVPLPNDDADKIGALAGHMSFGLVIGGLLLLRFGLRLGTRHPPKASTGNALLDRIGQATHLVFYVLILGMVMSGMAMAQSYGLFDIVFSGSGDPLPPVFDSPARAAHGAIATALMVLIVLHVAAAIYHQAMLKDRLLGRMWFGRRES